MGSPPRDLPQEVGAREGAGGGGAGEAGGRGGGSGRGAFSAPPARGRARVGVAGGESGKRVRREWEERIEWEEGRGEWERGGERGEGLGTKTEGGSRGARVEKRREREVGERER